MKKIIFLITFASIVFNILIAFDILPFLRGPAPYPDEWNWEYKFINTFGRIWFPLIVLAFILSLTFKIESKNKLYLLKNEKLILILLIILNFIFQIAIIYFGRSGIGVLLQRIVDPGLNGYFTTAVNVTDLGHFLENYHIISMDFAMHARAHPPGVIFFILLLNKILSFFPFLGGLIDFLEPGKGFIYEIWVKLKPHEQIGALVSGFIFPFFSGLAIIPIYFFGKLFFDVKIAIRSAVLYLFIPSVILFTPLPDVVFPIFSISAIFMFFKGLVSKNIYYFFISGLIMYLGLFFGLNLLPFLLFIFILFLINFTKNKDMKYHLKIGLSFLVGVIIPFILLYIFFQFNFIEFARNSAVKNAEVLLSRQYLLWVFFNLLDFLIFAGIPISIIFLMQIKQNLIYVFRKEWGKINPLFASFIFTLLVLNFSGVNKGEVSRLWLSFIPIMVLITVKQINTDFKFGKYGFLIILFLQAIQILAMQEFWVTLW